jgi:hypothetical protein
VYLADRQNIRMQPLVTMQHPSRICGLLQLCLIRLIGSAQLTSNNRQQHCNSAWERTQQRQSHPPAAQTAPNTGVSNLTVCALLCPTLGFKGSCSQALKPSCSLNTITHHANIHTTSQYNQTAASCSIAVNATAHTLNHDMTARAWHICEQRQHLACKESKHICTVACCDRHATICCIYPRRRCMRIHICML